MNKTDDLGAWRHFLAFSKAGGMAAAAERSGVDVSSVTRAVAGLERALGCTLVRRGVKPLTLTDEGRRTARRIEAILRAHDALMASLSKEAGAASGTIRLSCAPGFAARWLTPLLRDFNEAWPDIMVEILTGLKESDLAQGRCDVAVLTGEPETSGLFCRSRGRNVYLPVASPEYVARHGVPLSPSQLFAHKGYVYNGPVRTETKTLIRAGRSEPVKFGSTVRSADILAVREAVLQGLGVAVDLPLVQIVDDLEAGRLVPILPGWFRPPIECYAAAGAEAWRLKRVRLFMDWFAQAMQDYFSAIERRVSSIVGLPPDAPPRVRSAVFKTER